MRTLILAILNIICIWTIPAQVLDDESVVSTVKYRNEIDYELVHNIPSLLKIEDKYSSNGFDYNSVVVEVALVYTKDEQTDFQDREWDYSLNLLLYDAGSTPNSNDAFTISINNRRQLVPNTNIVPSAVHEDVTQRLISGNSGQKICKILSQNSSNFSNLPNDIRLELRLVYKNLQNIDLLALPIMQIPEIQYSKNENTTPVEGHSILKLKWEDMHTEFYELAYTFIDVYDQNTYSPKELFDQSIIIETNKNWYDMDLSYPEGSLYVWVRQSGKKFNQVLEEVEGIFTPEWNFDEYKLVEISEAVAFESDHNWQFQTSFAEEGKFKKVINYYDNSLRNQQTITYLNDENVALVAETDYDLEGRSSVQVLPAPAIAVSDGVNKATNLFYKPNFNQASDATENPIPYDFFAFEREATLPLHTISGASQYFSPNNNSHLINSIHTQFIPDAAGFPVVQTKYLRDNTGRIAAQSGVGEDYNLSSNHSTVYHYLTPSETELRRLFGADIGNSSHYKKNITLDANGQASAAYLDMNGKVVATCLLGASPANVEPLSSQPMEETNVLALATNQINTQQATTSSNTYLKLEPLPEDVTINYAFTGGFASTSEPFHCFVCPYDLQIVVKDPDGEIIHTESRTYSNGNGNWYETGLCTPGVDPFDDNFSFTVTLPAPGLYTIEKNLSTISPTLNVLNEIESIVNTYLNDEIQQVQEIAEQNFDPGLCAITCSQYCNAIYGEEQTLLLEKCINDCKLENNMEFLQQQIADNCNGRLLLMEKQIDDNITNTFLLTNLQANLANVNHPYKEMIIYDVEGNEYVWKYLAGEMYIRNNNTLTLVAESGVVSLNLLKSDGVEDTYDIDLEDDYFGIISNIISRTNPSNYWQPQFAKVLVNCHREFCHYNRCLEAVEFTAYDASLSEIEDINQAFTKFMVDNTASNKYDLLLQGLRNNDPFYDESPIIFDVCTGLPQNSQLDALIDNFEDLSEDEVGFCNFLASPPNNYPCDFYGFMHFMEYYMTPGNSNFQLQGATKEEALWRLFKSYYLYFKDKLYSSNDCSGCDFLTPDDNILFTKSVTADLTDYMSVINLFEAIQTGSVPGGPSGNVAEQNCEGRVGYLVEKYVESYNQIQCLQDCYFDFNNEPPYLETRLQDYCNNNCNFNFSGPCYSSNASPYQGMTFSENLLDLGPLYGVADNYPWEVYIIDEALVSLDPILHFESGPVNLLGQQDFVEDYNFPENELNGCIEANNLDHNHLLVLGTLAEGSARLVVHTNNCEAEDLNNLNVNIYTFETHHGHIIDFQIVSCNLSRNIYNDIIIDFDVNQSVFLPNKLFIIDFFSTESNPQTKPFAFELFSNYNYEVSSFHKYETNSKGEIYLRDLTTLFNDLYYNPCTTWDAGENCLDDYLSEVWNCEHACYEINECFEEIIKNIQNWINTYKIQSNFLNYSKTLPIEYSTCFPNLNIVFKHLVSADESKINWWFEVTGAENLFPGSPEEPTILRFITEDGLVPDIYSYSSCNPPVSNVNCKKLNILKFVPTGINYSTFIHKNSNNEYYFPNIKFLLKNKIFQNICGPNYCGSLEHIYFNTAYLAIENKNPNVPLQLTTECNVVVDFDQLNSDCENDLMNAVAEAKEELTEQIRNRVISSFLSIPCNPANEDFSLTESSFPEHHHTLYYYDQVGNLLATVPPRGVNPLPPASFNAFGELINNTQLPTHELITSYQYNSFNQITSSTTPDAGTSAFIYDNLQRLRISQNAQQSMEGNVSYTQYDDLSRIREVGEIQIGSTPINTIDPNDVLWPEGTALKSDVIQTTYSQDITNINNVEFDHGISRGRVSTTTRFMGAMSENNTNQSIYKYDIHGNVNTLWQRIISPEGIGLATKKLEYDYDLISGNVKHLFYNPGRNDYFGFKYRYDADNRLIHSYHTLDNLVWNEDARYFYYLHGPLARVEIGEDKVQGFDYAYTLQGWIKTMNRPGSINPNDEPGTDGNTINTNLNRYIGRDATAYGLGYNNNDYVSIAGNTLGFNNVWSDSDISTSLFNGSPGLYNGNISIMNTDFKNHLTNQAPGLSLFSYRYDQLHRIKNATHFTQNNNDYLSSGLYTSNYNYDANGNITSLNRMGHDANLGMMDNLTYDYFANTNRLETVTESINENVYNNDVDNGNVYLYDAIGNLTQTIDNGQQFEISWDVYNKINAVTSPNTSGVSYSYDASGNKVSKNVNGNITYYVRDAQGNILSTYGGPGNNEWQREINLYGSSRLGVLPVNKSYALNSQSINKSGQRNLALPRYEASNHLGNVLATFTGRKLGQGSGTTVDHYEPEIVSLMDYYPFGQEMQGRSIANEIFNGSNNYRYGFNGKEQSDNNETGSLTSYDYGFRIYNPGIARFLSVDPLTKDYPMLTPYQFASNRPIDGIDLDGLEYNDAKLNITIDHKYSKIKVTGTLEVYVKILNLSSKPISQLSKNFHDDKSSTTFDNLNPIAFYRKIPLNPENGKSLNKDYYVEGKVNIDFKFVQVIKSINEINKGDVVLVVVNDMPKIDAETEGGGEADKGGHAYILTNDAFNSKTHIDTHEKGHLIGDLLDQKGEDAKKGYLMSYKDDGNGYQLTIEEKRNIIENIIYRIAFFKFTKEKNDTKKDVKELLKKNGKG